jgi:hypothetical protein
VATIQPPPAPVAVAAARPTGLRLASAAEPLPAPAVEPACRGCGLPAGCGPDCNRREVVDIHLATPYGVSGHLLIPVIGDTARGAGSCELSFAAGATVKLTATKTKAGTWRLNEFFESTPDTIRIAVPAVFTPPAKASLTFLLRDGATGTTAGTFSIPAPPFDPRSQEYVLAGADLRNFVGDTSRPATDKTLRGAVKPYLDSLGTGSGSSSGADGRSVADRDLTLTAELATDQKTIPIEAAITVTVRETNQAADPAPAAAE